MRTSKGIRCSVNQYKVTAVSVVNGQPVSFSFTSNARDKKQHSAYAADELTSNFGTKVKPSQVLINYETVKKSFTINAAVSDVFAALDAAHIDYTVNEDSADSE